jgi:hypothetical protein
MRRVARMLHLAPLAVMAGVTRPGVPRSSWNHSDTPWGQTMDQNRFATLTRTVTRVPSRRDLLRGLAATGLGIGTLRLPRLVLAYTRPTEEAAARANQYGCLDVGARCKQASQCCSGICERRNGKKKCRAHHRGGCAATSDSCWKPVTCETSGYCFRTTGNASFCGELGGTCSGCAKDIDCEPTHGPGAACVVCAECAGTTCFAAAV